MEAREEPGRIRPLPPEVPDAAGPESSPPPPPDRRWVPIAVAGAALVFFGLLAGLFGSGTQGDDLGAGAAGATATTAAALGGEPPPSTTTTTEPPALRAMASVLARPLQIIYRNHAATTTSRATWNLDATEPTDVMTTGAAAVLAAYDASRQQVLLVTEGQNRTLWVGQPPIAEPVFVNVAGAHWHPNLARALAWVGTAPGAGEPHLYRASSLSTTGLEGLDDLGPVPARSELVGWGDWGYVLRVGVPVSLRQWEVDDPAGGAAPAFQLLEFTVVLDPLGAQLAALPGTPLAAGPKGAIALRPANEAFTAAREAGLDPVDLGIAAAITQVPIGAEGEPVVVLGPNLAPTSVAFEPPSAVSTFVFSPDGAYVSALGELEGRYSVTTQALDGGFRRITSVDRVNSTIGFSRDGALLILHNRDSGDIVFHDWNRGASFRIPFNAGRVLAVDG
ncbi:MAG TPA: hypothetical protein VLG28_15655 [Acidimicrobiia bacterium]|jgi:hypothetical protein|nr:hypothetical protein [Acidimicrobiia bacterium]